MSMPDPFPVDQNRIIQALERRVADLEALVRQAKGTPIVQASGPFFLPNSGTPARPSGGPVIYGSGGDFRVITSSGQVKQIPAQGPSVPNPVINLFNPPANYDQAHIRTITDTCESLANSYTALLQSLRLPGIIAP
ncbi:hypothetical protein [Streptosporangium sp. NPDC087985]|uniref:hypothetical protein n=1 Tax=Streptosporangium sp. NPDC087985 TaxID=3366196 RepID=UPI00382ADDC0